MKRNNGRTNTKSPRGAGGHGYLAIVAIMGLLAGLAGMSGTVRAQDTASVSPVETSEWPWLNIRTQELKDLDQDGRFDTVQLFGYWSSSVGDTLTIYDYGDDLPTEGEPNLALSLDRGTWVFDHMTRGFAALIVQFTTDGANVSASIWDDQNGDGRVSYEVRGRQAVITESPNWTTKVWAEGSWLRSDGRLNYRIHALFDGCGSCNRAADESAYPEAVRARMQIDGTPDFATDITDDDNDGVPEYFIWHMLTDVPVTLYGIPRLGIQANEGRKTPSDPTGFVFWPLFSPVPAEAGLYFDTPPVVPVRWDSAEIEQLGLVGYPIEAGFHINSYAYVGSGQSVYANFEDPMAYYDIAEDRDGFPELMVRVGYGKANDPMMLSGQANVPIMDIRYSWNLSDSPSLTWTHKVGLAGRYEITETTKIGDFDVLTVPYAQLPGWVMEREWDGMTFVSNERGATLQSSEGIYDYSASDPSYYAGLDASPPIGWDSETNPGLRGDWSWQGGKPELYFDPIDRSLHLVGAEGGIWNIDGRRELRYRNNTGGETFDGWELWRDGLLVAQLHRIPGGLLYSDEEQTLFRAVDVPEPGLRTLPPVDHATWQAMRDALATQPSAFEPGDLQAMFDQFAGDVTVIASGPLFDLNRTDGTVRFIVDANAPATQKALAALTGSVPSSGEQVVEFAGGRWSVSPVVYSNPAPQLAINDPRALVGTSIEVRVDNLGSADSTDAYVGIEATPPPDSGLVGPIFIGRQDIEVAGNSSISFDMSWIPPQGGTWEFEAIIYRSGSDPDVPTRGGRDVVLAQSTATFDVAPAISSSPARVLRTGWVGSNVMRLLVAAALVLGAAGALAVLVRPGRANP